MGIDLLLGASLYHERAGEVAVKTLALTLEPVRVTAALFLRLLGAVYVSAFVSLWVQIDGLIGANGIAPAGDLLALARDRLGGSAPFALPTLLWLTGAGDRALHALCAAGVAAGLALVAGRARFWAAALAWLAYLSLCSVGDVFLSFQWDALLLESGLVALFAASREPALGIWLARALLWKLMFLSGAVKLLSGDPTWRDLSALSYHWWTQPLPLATSAWAAALPDALQRVSTAGALAIELGAPFGLLGPRRVRLVALGLLVALQLLIALTGNYGFFNLLALALCATWLDDRALVRLARLAPVERSAGPTPLRVARRAGALALLAASLIVAAERLTPEGSFPSALWGLVEPLQPLRSVNSYGLFAVMTTDRREILLEGSADGVEWRGYEFRWKPGAPDRAPRFAATHMPRVDWQLWFAALGRCEHQGWLHAFLRRLLEGSRPVTRLLANDPFPDQPPRYLRATVARYRFATGADWAGGAWWSRSPAEPYCPVLTLRDGRLALADDLPP
jgi:lipase maturation factor 1